MGNMENGAFEEFAKRIEAEDKRQNTRLDKLEHGFELINNLYVSVEKLAQSMESMAKEISRQGEVLHEMEMKPAKRWDLVVSTIITGLTGALAGMIIGTFIK